MKILAINGFNCGSTGNIMLGIQKESYIGGIDYYVAYPDSRTNRKKEVTNGIVIGNILTRNINDLLCKKTGYICSFNFLSTLIFLKRVKRIRPDIIHLHNLHGNYINIKMLFKFLNKHSDIKVVWTLHDCWSFTGRCPHFIATNCDKWKYGCGNCPYPKKYYPAARIDHTQKLWTLKKRLFASVKNLFVVTPSKWLQKLTRESILNQRPITVINNGIDLSKFKPTSSNFISDHNLQGQFVLLGVADSWGERKGLNVFVELSKRLPAQYSIVLVGTDSEIEKALPKNIISIHRTSSQTELAEIYTAANLLVNPTREEVLGLVNVESLACGTPVVTFDSGGSPECVDSSCGSVVERDNVDALEKEIIRICETNPFDARSCIQRAKKFDMNDRFKEYVRLYRDISRETIDG